MTDIFKTLVLHDLLLSQMNDLINKRLKQPRTQGVLLPCERRKTKCTGHEVGPCRLLPAYLMAR